MGSALLRLGLFLGRLAKSCVCKLLGRHRPYLLQAWPGRQKNSLTLWSINTHVKMRSWWAPFLPAFSNISQIIRMLVINYSSDNFRRCKMSFQRGVSIMCWQILTSDNLTKWILMLKGVICGTRLDPQKNFKLVGSSILVPTKLSDPESVAEFPTHPHTGGT